MNYQNEEYLEREKQFNWLVFLEEATGLVVHYKFECRDGLPSHLGTQGRVENAFGIVTCTYKCLVSHREWILLREPCDSCVFLLESEEIYKQKLLHHLFVSSTNTSFYEETVYAGEAQYSDSSCVLCDGLPFGSSASTFAQPSNLQATFRMLGCLFVCLFLEGFVCLMTCLSIQQTETLLEYEFTAPVSVSSLRKAIISVLK